jgi:hypothetical protein
MLWWLFFASTLQQFAAMVQQLASLWAMMWEESDMPFLGHLFIVGSKSRLV